MIASHFLRSFRIRRAPIVILIVSGMLIIGIGLLTSRNSISQNNGAQIPGAVSIDLSERKKINVPPPSQNGIEVPQKYRGISVVPDKFGKEREVNSSESYRFGYMAGWGEFLNAFQCGRIDIDESDAEFAERFAELIQIGAGADIFYAGHRAGASACRSALIAFAKVRSLVYLPIPHWQSQLRVLGACEPELNSAGHPIRIWWNWTTKSQNLNDDDLKIFKEIPLEDIEALGMRHVSVSDAGISGLPLMPQLRQLDIDSTNEKLTGALLNSLCRFSTLRNLNIVGLRSVNASDFAAIGQLKKLESLDLTAIALDDAAVPILIGLPNLSTLLLDWSYDGKTGPKLTPAGISQLGKCRKLTTLRMTDCAVNDEALASLASSLPKLEELFVGKTNITDASIGSLRKLSKLKSLNIKGTKVTDTGFAKLASHPSLEEVLIKGTLIGDASLATLASMPKLREVWCGPKQFSRKALSEFKKQHPKMSIDIDDTPEAGGEVPVDSIR
jgi:hypothetical protein